MTVVRVQGNQAFPVDLGIGELPCPHAVIRPVEGPGGVARRPFTVEGDLKLEDAVGKIDDGGGKRLGKGEPHKLGTVRLEAEAVAVLVFPVKGFVNLFTIGTCLYLPVFGKQFQT